MRFVRDCPGTGFQPGASRFGWHAQARRRRALLLSLLPVGIACTETKRPVPVELLTVAEKSDFKATALYGEVIDLLDRLSATSPLVRRVEMGRTVEGRSIPVVLISDPPVASPQEAKRQIAERGKLLVLAIGNIHAGEVDGKEALPMLARELVTTPRHPLLKDLIVAIAPIYNADGNERVSKDNRPGQVGPEEGMGQRENAAGLDLNRDFIKLEAPETRGLVRFFNEWDPAIFIDTHTTNGSFHRYLVTFEGPKSPAGDAGIVGFVRDAMLPAVSRLARAKYGVPTFFYGDFNREHTRWETYPASGRYGTSYVGLRNRISVLSEGYSYAPYRDRVLATRDFVKACLEYAAAHKSRIHSLLSKADAFRERQSIALRCEPMAAPAKVTAAGYVEERKNGKTVATTRPCDYEVEIWNRYRPTLSVPRPSAYLFPAGLSRVREVLQLHGVETAALRDDQDLTVEMYRIDKVEFAERPFQNHRLATVEATPRVEIRRFPAGTIVVPLDQKLGNLAAYLLEPQSEDGLATWNFFDNHLAPGQDFPVVRVMGTLPRINESRP